MFEISDRGNATSDIHTCGIDRYPVTDASPVVSGEHDVALRGELRDEGVWADTKAGPACVAIGESGNEWKLEREMTGIRFASDVRVSGDIDRDGVCHI